MDKKEQVLKALEHPDWEWRTVKAVAKEIGLPPDEIAEILESSPNEIIRSEVPDKYGRALYTTRRHYQRTQSIFNRFRKT